MILRLKNKQRGKQLNDQSEVAQTKELARYWHDRLPHPDTKPRRLTLKAIKAERKAIAKAVPLTELTYRRIATMFVKALPVDGEEYAVKVEEYLTIIKALPREAKIALRMAYVFGSKAPIEEREDLFQELALALLKAKAKDERLAYAIARCDWRNWWGKYRIRQHTSLDSVVDDGEGNATTLGELIVGEADFEEKMDGKLEAHRIWQKLDSFPAIKTLVAKRLTGRPLSNLERDTLNRWVAKFGVSLLLA
jgi:hypothetical protein